MQASFAGLAHGILDLLRAAAPCLGVAVSRWGAFARLAGERCISRARGTVENSTGQSKEMP